MTIYVTPENKLYDDADGAALSLPNWPKDARIATQEEINAIRNPILPIAIPSQVTMVQARLALFEDGLLSLVDESISLMPIEEQREKAKIEWEFATIVSRNSALVYGLAGALGLTDEKLDELFIKASKL